MSKKYAAAMAALRYAQDSGDRDAEREYRELLQTIERSEALSKTIAGARKGRKINRKNLKDGDAELITSAHPDERLRAIGKMFEDLCNEPLARRFLRKKPKLVAGNDTFFKQKNCTIPGALCDDSMTIAIPEREAKDEPLEEIKAVLAHELGHAMALDTHFRNIEPRNVIVVQQREFLADKISVVLTGNAEAAKRRLIRSQHKLEAVAPNHNGMKEHLEKVNRGHGEHPPLQQRLDAIDQLAQQMAKPGGIQLAQDDLARKLNERHKQLFPHRPER
jgi:hypothetical protein